jgi:hypothetical protein
VPLARSVAAQVTNPALHARAAALDGDRILLAAPTRETQAVLERDF